MALDATKWSISSTTKEIAYDSGTYPHGNAGANYVTVLELHRWLQSLADDAASTGDDFMDITRLTPSDKKFSTIIELLNGFWISDTTAQYIYGGSIIQNDGGGEDIFDGIQVVANRGCYVDIIQNGARITTDFWNSTPSGESVRGINFDSATGVSARFMIKVKDAGTDIDGNRLLFQTREWGKTYSEFKIPGTGRGINVVPLTYADDLNNTTVVTDVFNGTLQAPFTTIENTGTYGYLTLDVDEDTVSEEYYSEWNRGSATINQFYEYMKYLTRRTETATIYGCPGELFRGITHAIAYSGITNGPFAENSGTKVTWSAAAGEGYVVANDAGDSILYICHVKGPAPTGLITQGTTTATADTVTEKTISTPFCGQSTGSSIVGGYGFTLETADLTKNDKILALDGVTRSPPNNATFTVDGLAVGYSVLVGPASGGNLQTNQFTTTATYDSAGVTSIAVSAAIPADTPATGTIRIELDSGAYRKVAYTSYTGSTFTIGSTDFSGANAAATGNDVFISYIDNDSVDGTSVNYLARVVSTRDLFVRVRFAGSGPVYADAIKTFQGTSQFKDGGNTITAVITSDA